MVNVYIPSRDIVVHVYLGSSVGRSHAFRAESRRFESRPVGFFFSVYYYFLLISKDGCEKGRCDPKVLDINALVASRSSPEDHQLLYPRIKLPSPSDR